MDSRSMSSRLRDLVKFLSSVQGDLSNITAPPHFLAGSSVVEVGHCWAQRPAVFAAPALEPSAERRSWLVLRLVLMALRSQFYVGGSPMTSIKKPLNAFLGELFVASWHDAEGKATTRLVAEQVSHHPPITAMHIADTEHGVRADGYARVNMTFGGSVDVRQVGHAVLHVDRYDEDYLIPLPDVKVRGFLGGRLYPEICGTYTIVSSSGFVSEINFSGAGYFSGQKNSFSARTYRRDDPSRRSIYTVSGCWSDGWTALDARTGEVLEKYDCEGFEHVAVPAELPPLAQQDPFESRRAWAGVLDGLARGDFRAVVQDKTALEQAQRRMRAEEKSRGHKGESGWTPLFFESMSAEEHEIFQRLSKGTEWALHADKTKGVWRVREEAVGGELKRPFREGMTPLGYQ